MTFQYDLPIWRMTRRSQGRSHDPCVTDPEPAKQFHAAAVDNYHVAKRELNYPATYFLRMLSDYGGVEAARRLLHSPTVSDGFVTLWEKGRLDLSVEAMVLQERFRSLFSPEELKIARKRLAQYGYEPPSTDR